MIVRWEVEILVFANSVSFWRMSIIKFDTAVAPVTATFPTAYELFKPCEIDSRARSSPRIPWATAKAEASSNDEETRSPVETLFCVMSNRRLTELRALSAVNADGLVKTEF